MPQELNYAVRPVRKQLRLYAELDAFVGVFVEYNSCLLAQLIRFFLGIAFHNFCNQVLITVFLCRPWVAKNAQFRYSWLMLWIITFSLAHSCHFTDKLSCIRILITLLCKMISSSPVGLDFNHEVTSNILEITRALPTQRRILIFLLRLLTDESI